MEKRLFVLLVIITLVFLTGCVASNNLSSSVEDRFKVRLVKVRAFSQVDETFVRKMASDKVIGKNGEYLVFLFDLRDKVGNPVAGVPLVWRTKGDNNIQVQKTDVDGQVSFWEPVGALPNSLSSRKSKWGKMLKDMKVKTTVNPVGIKNCKVVVKIQLYK